MDDAALTVLNLYALTGTAPDFREAVGRLAGRVLSEGERGVLSYRFYVNPTAGAARAVVEYADADAWIGHHETAMRWPEMAALHRVARLDEVIFLGIPDARVTAWIAASTLKARIIDGFSPAAGFRRAPAG